MVWLPDWLWEKQQQQRKGKGGRKGGGFAHRTTSVVVPPSWTGRGGRVSGKGYVNSWGGGSKGGGKGKYGNSKGGVRGQWVLVSTSQFRDPARESQRRSMDKFQKFDADCKMWIGGLKPSVTWKTLEKHIEETTGTKPKITEVMGKGTGCAAFEDAGAASSAIESLNGSELKGGTIEADVWTEKEKKEGEKPKRKFGAAFLKSKGDNPKAVSRVDPEKKVWVGGMKEDTSTLKIKKHFKDSGCTPKLVRIMKPGSACVTFDSEEEAASAISKMNGTELEGESLELDVWTKLDKTAVKEEKAAKKIKKE